MAYATRAMIEEIWGAEFVGDLLNPDVDASEAIDSALARASGEVDVHLSSRYTTPLPGLPEALKMPTVNIAVYNLAIRHAMLTTTIEDRYKQAVDLLKRIADGKAGLGADEPKVSQDPSVSPDGASFSANKRIMGRDRLP